MQYDTLGPTEHEVSKICLGTMTWGQQNTEAEAHEQLDYALERGINFIDVAEMYPVPSRKETQGRTEAYIGTWIAKRQNRDRYFLATKATGPSQNLSFIRDPLDFSREGLTQALEGSLERLQTDYVDLYQLHWPERKANYFGKRGFEYDPDDRWTDNIHEVLATLKEFMEEGKVRYIGLSNETPWGVMRFLREAEKHDLPRIVSVQNPYSLLNRTYETGLAEMSIREQAGLLAYSPLGFGLLSGKYHRKVADEKSRINQFAQMARYNSGNSWEATSRYLAIADAHGLSLAQMALAFVNTRPFVTSNIIGATSMEQLRENIDSIEVSLKPEVMEAIEAVHQKIPNPAP